MPTKAWRPRSLWAPCEKLTVLPAEKTSLHRAKGENPFRIRKWLSNEIRANNGLARRHFDSGILSRFDALHNPRHIATKRAHGLHALFVAHDFLGRVSMDLVPILRTNNYHIRNGEVLIQLVERCRCAPATAAGNSGSRLAGKQVTPAIERAIHVSAPDALAKCTGDPKTNAS